MSACVLENLWLVAFQMWAVLSIKAWEIEWVLFSLVSCAARSTQRCRDLLAHCSYKGTRRWGRCHVEHCHIRQGGECRERKLLINKSGASFLGTVLLWFRWKITNLHTVGFHPEKGREPEALEPSGTSSTEPIFVWEHFRYPGINSLFASYSSWSICLFPGLQVWYCCHLS